MPLHVFICDKCNVSITDNTTKGVHKCPKCGGDMRWDLTGIGITKGDYNHVSDALAIHPSQITEHRQKFPGVDVLPDGRIHFTSVKQHSDYIEKCNIHKPMNRTTTKGISKIKTRKLLSKAASV